MQNLKPQRERHDGLGPLPNVEMGPLRRLVGLVNVLERVEAGEFVEGYESGNGVNFRGMMMPAVTCHLANIALGLKRVLAEVRAPEQAEGP